MKKRCNIVAKGTPPWLPSPGIITFSENKNYPVLKILGKKDDRIEKTIRIQFLDKLN